MGWITQYCNVLIPLPPTIQAELELMDAPTPWDLKNLVAWQVAMDFAAAVYAVTRRFPDDERFGLRLQLRRSAASVPSNIAEGHGRTSPREYARFLLIARGSLKEAETQLLLAARLNYIDVESVNSILPLSSRVNRLLTGLQRRLKP
jgi:four helix bundle protein